MKKYKIVFIDPTKPYGDSCYIEANSKKEAAAEFNRKYRGCIIQQIFELVYLHILDNRRVNHGS